MAVDIETLGAAMGYTKASLEGQGAIKGDKGDKGDKDEKGDTGERGPKGEQGLQGEQGVQGVQGPAGDPFEFYEIYSSISEMLADKDNVPLKKFVLINTNDVEDPDNSKMYVRTDEEVSGFRYLNDLSGATGIQGPAGPQGIQGPQGIPGPKGDSGVAYVEELTDVDLTNLQNGQVLKYNSTTQNWENANESGGGGGGESYVNPVLVNRSNLYSTSERIIGQWIDGKPVYQIVRDTPFSDVSLIPTMSSNTSDVCEVSSIGDYQSNYSYKAFDNDDTTHWASTTNNYGYLNVHFFTAQTVAKISLKPRKPGAYASVKDFEIWGSNDNFATHDVLLSATCQNSSDIQNFDLTTIGSYSYYRLNILNVWTTDAMSAAVIQLNLIGEGQSGITVLDTRIINGKYIYQYTKNTDTAQAISVSDDYSTTETMIGHWIDGKPLYQIVNPEQVEIGVPILTEDNTRLIHSTQLYTAPEFYPWKAFDGDITTKWVLGAKSGYVGWDFERGTKITQFKFGLGDTTQLATQILLRYSDDGTNWTTVHTYDVDTDYQRTTDIQTFDIEEDVGEHRYWGMHFSRPGDWPSFHTINFISSAYPPEWNMVRYEKALDGSEIYQYTKTTD